MSKETKLPALTDLNAIKEALDVRLGRRGNPLDRAVTLRDLLDGGLPIKVTYPRGPWPTIEYEAPTDRIVPPAPTGFIAQSVFGGIHLLWDSAPRPLDIGLVEVHRARSPVVEERQFLTATGGNSYFDIIDSSDTTLYYYWVRFRSVTGHYGPFAGPLSATALPLVSDLLDRLSGEINESHLAQQLAQRIDLIDGEGGLIDQVREQGEAFAQQITQVQTRVGEDVAAVQQTISTQVARIDGQLVALGAGYTAQVQANGLIGGFGIYNDGTRVDAAFDVDRFWIGRANAQNRRPFVVQNGAVYIDTALIRDASIQEGKIGPISFGKIRLADGTPVTTAAGLLRADAIDVNNLVVSEAATVRDAAITTAKIANAAVTAAKIGNAQITTAKIQDAAVDTLQIRGQAVTFPRFSYVASTQSLSTSDRELGSLSFTPSAVGVPLQITVSVRLYTGSTGIRHVALTNIVYLSILHNNNLIWTGPVLYGMRNNAVTNYPYCATTVVLQRPALSGVNSFSFRARYNHSDWSGANASSRFLGVMELKR